MHTILNKLKTSRIVVVGDVMVDVNIIGTSNRVSPEAPVPVVEQQKREIKAGGAANVACNLAALGCDVLLLGLVGEDLAVLELEEILHDRGVTCHLIRTDQPTIEKIRVFSDNQQLIRYDREEKFTTGHDKLIAALKELGDNYILVSDYAKGTITPEVMQSIAHKKLLIDPKPRHKELYRGSYLMTPNLKEAREMCESETVAEMGKELMQYSEHVVITQGSEGLTLFERGCAAKSIPTHAQAVYDVTGAGDTFIAALSAAISTGSNLSDACALGNLAAGLAVERVGTATVSSTDILHRLEKKSVHSREELASIVAQAKAQGKTVVTTNGCFDVLHVGHLRLIKEAKKQGDILILGINDDAYVKRTKGAMRPIVTQDERAEMLAALDCVDYVTIFSEDNPVRLLETIQPNIHVKGGDYDPTDFVTMPEAKTMQEIGGKVVIVPLVQGKSTTNIVEKIKNAS